MTEKLVTEAFQKSVTTLVATFATSIPVKMLGRTFKPPNDQKYLEVVIIPNNNIGRFWGDEKLYQGIFRLILHWPIDDEGVYNPLEIVALIESYYKKSNTLRIDDLTLKIYKNANFTGMIETSKEVLFPVSIEYRSFQP